MNFKQNDQRKKNFFRDILINEHPPGMISSIFFYEKLIAIHEISMSANIILSSTTAAF